jgi:hypothetical protein
MRLHRWLALSSMLISACDCGGHETVRCAEETPTLSEPRQVGSVHVVPTDHVLAFEGLPEEARWVFARGPALSREPIPPMVDAIEALHPDAVMMMGSLGSGERLAALLAGLGELTVPVVLLPGPRDARTELSEAIASASAHANLIDAVGVQRITWGTTELLLVPGAESGRYAIEGACAFEEADLESVIGGSDAAHFRMLIAFAAPAGTLQTQGLVEAEAGSALVRTQMESAALEAGVFAWPSTRIGLPFGAGAQLAPASTSTQFRMIVPSIAGPAIEGEEGGRALPQATLLRIGPQGAQLVPAT